MENWDGWLTLLTVVETGRLSAAAGIGLLLPHPLELVERLAGDGVAGVPDSSNACQDMGIQWPIGRQGDRAGAVRLTDRHVRQFGADRGGGRRVRTLITGCDGAARACRRR